MPTRETWLVFWPWVTSHLFFFFQAEDGIRDLTVTGVQTCALPIYRGAEQHADPWVVAAEVPGDAARFLHGGPGACYAGGNERLPQIEQVGVEHDEIGRASGRERVEISVVAVSLKKKKKQEREEARW